MRSIGAQLQIRLGNAVADSKEQQLATSQRCAARERKSAQGAEVMDAMRLAREAAGVIRLLGTR
eukprot:CAMPEP_0169416102 /NCGR_PEP_ID=MMETSP1017-20121227/62926_1 /TAXON_ID=342587 /ORGANISM="Karlodinium micrum, Strain CCMP2283" /LENGTH=63 /DNA_ID=CAMNT_0009523993 /DNA_START=308 /DNA_END=496 /DNA_ORIENTATION=+